MESILPFQSYPSDQSVYCSANEHDHKITSSLTGSEPVSRMISISNIYTGGCFAIDLPAICVQLMQRQVSDTEEWTELHTWLSRGLTGPQLRINMVITSTGNPIVKI